jgi:hypothetical protein
MELSKEEQDYLDEGYDRMKDDIGVEKLEMEEIEKLKCVKD